MLFRSISVVGNLFYEKYFFNSPKKFLSKRRSSTIAVTPKVQRPIRQEPGPVIAGLIPKEWLLFFKPKTGVTGLGTFMFTIGTTLVSKEIYVLEHEFYNGLAMLLVCITSSKYIGADVAKFLDKEIDEYEASLNKERNYTKEVLESQIKYENELQHIANGQLMLVAAKRENVALQLEAVYRERLMQVYKKTKNGLDCAVAMKDAENRFCQKHMVKWVNNKVTQSITRDLANEIINKCLDELDLLAKLYELPVLKKVKQ